MMSDLKKELDSLDLPLLIEYGVSAKEKAGALEVYERFKKSAAAVSLLRCYYSDLPEAREEVAVDLKVVAAKQGSVLSVLRSTHHDYLYLHTNNQALFLGEFKDGVEDEAILRYFEFESAEDFWKKTGSRPEDLPSLPTAGPVLANAVCVACGVEEGEYHMLGCPVEPCPWCQAQLSRCNCRFDQMGVNSIEEDEQLDRFQELLEQKGRIAFAAAQNPAYPVAGDDPAPFSEDKDQ